MSHHPFTWLSDSGQKRLLVVFVIVTLILAQGLTVLGEPLKQAASPWGIISFEFAGTLSAAQAMVAGWKAEGKEVYAGLNLGLDYLYLVCYTTTIALGCVLVARQFTSRLPFLTVIGNGLAWAQFGAALLDASENYALIQVLLGSTQALWPALAWWCALPKFIIVLIGLGFIVIGSVGLILWKLFGNKQAHILPKL